MQTRGDKQEVVCHCVLRNARHRRSQKTVTEPEGNARLLHRGQSLSHCCMGTADSQGRLLSSDGRALSLYALPAYPGGVSASPLWSCTRN